MKIPVKFLNFNPSSPERGYWDMYLIEKMLSGPEFEEYISYPSSTGGHAIIVVPGRHNVEFADQINTYINRLAGVLLIIAGDEEASFPLERLQHPNMKLWMMTPHQDKKYMNVDHFIGEGPTPHCEKISKEAPSKTQRWFFAGQNTHKRRGECIRALRKVPNGKLIETLGFTQGIPPEEYINELYKSVVIPCPSGPATPDTFRFYEALEAGCIPIADAISSRSSEKGYWHTLFGEDLPFPVLEDWSKVEDYINFFNDTYPNRSNKVFAWWQMYKRNLYHSLLEDYHFVTGNKMNNSGLTAIIPTSPGYTNPSTAMIEETIATIRHHHPDIEIIITFDGVRKEQETRRPNYEEYIRKMLWKCNHVYKNIVPIVFEDHTHQVGMMREAMKYVRTDKILYMEHDAPLTPDLPIEWGGIFKMIDSRLADVMRFHFESFIPQPHEYLMIDKTPVENYGVKAVRTWQWSQRPHVASSEFYNRILRDHFTAEAKTFIEDKMYSVLTTSFARQQIHGWNMFKVWLYHPDGNIKRSYHTDGRGSEEKYSMTF